MKLRHSSLICFCLFLIISLDAWAQNAITFVVYGLAKGPAYTNVIQALNNMQDELPKSVTQQAISRLYQDAPKQIKLAMQPYGYFRTQVTAHLYLNHKKHTWIMNFNINPGLPIKITHLDIQISGDGLKDPLFMRVLQHIPLHIDQPLNTPNYDDTKEKLFTHANNRGYFQARMLQNKIIINLITYQASVILHFYTGPRFRFGTTTFTKTKFSSKFLRRYLTYQPGEYYSVAKINETQKNLTNSDYFRQVVVGPAPKQANHLEVPIKIHLVPLKSQTYNFGLGYGSDTGIRGTVGIIIRRLNAYGHRMRFLLRGSERDSTGTVDYIIPGKQPAKENYTFSASGGAYNQPDGSNARGVSTSISYKRAYHHWQQIISLNYIFEDSYIPQLLPFQVQTNTLHPSILWNYLNLHGPELNPTSGINISLALTGASKDLFSTTNFFEVLGRAKALTTFRPTHTRFIARATYGYLDVNDLSKIPYSLQLFTGGARTIRGYEYNQFGPGHNLFDTSFEVQQRIYGQWYLGAFIDAGNVANSNAGLFKNLNIGVGPSILWLSPVGPIEVSIADAITNRNPGWDFQFTMGPEF